MKQYETLERLNREIIECSNCPRLVSFRSKVAKEKRRQFATSEYWGRPVPGFGDPKARLVIVGLAPASHGGNRTGRVFTGDSSARFLVSHLHKAGFANQPVSESRDDGLRYRDCYITAAVRCVPPDNKPTSEEMENCFPYLVRELALLTNAKVILALGRIAFDSVLELASRAEAGTKAKKTKFVFQHGQSYQFAENFPTVFASYHPSPRNTNTGKLTDAMFSKVLRDINRTLGNKIPTSKVAR